MYLDLLQILQITGEDQKAAPAVYVKVARVATRFVIIPRAAVLTPKTRAVRTDKRQFNYYLRYIL